MAEAGVESTVDPAVKTPFEMSTFQMGVPKFKSQLCF